MKHLISLAVFASGFLLAAQALPAAPTSISIRTDFPGGNVLVASGESGVIHVAPDLRGGKPWFYWYFEAEASEPGRVTFVFDGACIGVRGPAISLDDGESWNFLGREQVTYVQKATDGEPAVSDDSFFYDFVASHLKVRFAVAIPYVQSNLDEFLRDHAANPHLKRSVLAKTRGGLSVPLLQVGEPGSGRQAILMAARAHACETMGSYTLEGFLAEALSDSPAAQDFRARYVLYAIPILDLDGVQAGDQGKKRMPHDHNRDYGDVNRYPEVAAIQDIAEARDVRFAVDIHCPALRGDIHEAFYWAGLQIPHVNGNVKELTGWMREEIPRTTRVPIDLMKDVPANPETEGIRFSHYFGLRENSLIGVTLEVPYTQLGSRLDADLARAYGAGMLRAWTHAEFIGRANDAERKSGGHVRFEQFSEHFRKIYRKSPGEAEAMATFHLAAEGTSDIYRNESRLLMAMLRLNQRQYRDADRHIRTLLADPRATAKQRSETLVLQVRVASRDPETTPKVMTAALGAFSAFPHPADKQRLEVHKAAAAYYAKHADHREGIFRQLTLVRMEITLSAAAAESLRTDPRTWVSGQVTVDGSEFPAVALHLKGGEGSFRPLDDKPGFTLRFDKGNPGRRFHGLTKIHLNNSVQDSSYVCEDLAGELFRRAGVPASRTAWASVSLNGRALGLYVLKEGFNRDFLREHFGNDDGNFYDSGRHHSDIIHDLELDSGDGPEDRSDLAALDRAARITDPVECWSGLEAVLDTERFISFMAMEVLAGHADGYCLMQNNYRVYFDSSSGRAVFLPHGMDRMFWETDAPIEPAMKGLVAAAVMQTPEGAARYRKRLAELSADVFQPAWMIERAQAVAKLLEPVSDVAARDARLTGDRAAARAAYVRDAIKSKLNDGRTQHLAK